MTGTGRSSRDESSSTTDKGVVTCSSNDHESLTTLDGRRRVTLVALVLVDSERFTGNGRLINLEERVIGNNATVSRNDSSLNKSLERVPLFQSIVAGWTHFFNLENITGDDLGGLNFKKTTITENDSLQSKSLLQFFDDRTSLVFLYETNTGVE